MNPVEIDELWVVVWHPEGGIHAMQVLDLVEANQEACLQGKPGYCVAGICSSFDDANEKVKVLKRGRKEYLEQRNG